ncbi:MFS transporter, sugar porter (SP) family [Mucilaginibacter lappiensis]|uniref:Sugar porter (SP) family MFS transporter n=1 Tax=Mucilaginibacter lappiensis TaxID=354630 RepID=A0ABR6PH48_9SPHI|nr:sugar porter family MFS transporter [Mucilaginibacter lappiensis]MBB6109089.1 sugar porter (SP) family MFS transporter [Mucilaginibacter lappiensis]SIQ75154.1 MFS transporter, sugar porter (SP) family [Mucilaginibacter lappiensis]
MSSSKTFNSRYIIGISFISALGGYLFGFDFAVISGALPFLRTQFGLDPVWEGFLTGSLALGCIVGCLIAGNLADKYGRKPGLMVAALIFAVSSIGIAFAQTLTYFIVLRFAAGIGVGMASMLCPMYIAEVSPAEVRGRNVAINQLTVVIGILITNLVNYFLADHGHDAWRWMFGLGAVPSAVFLIGVTWLPESPRWLMKSGQVAKAQQVLNKIGSVDFVDTTMKAIEKSLAGSTAKQSYKMVFEKAVRPAVVVGITLAVFQQFCGINVVFNYTSTIFESVGANLNRQLLETVSIGVVNLVFTLLAMWQVDKLGRRPLMLVGSLGLSIMYIVLAVALQNHFPAGLVSIFVLLAISTYAISLAPVTWVLISEIFPNKIRGVASSVAIVSLWGAYFILVFTFPILAKKLGTYGPFYLYAAICFLGFLFVKARVKETKGQTLEELEENLIRH